MTMAIYSFVRPDGVEVEKSFPMGECPKEITCDDGVVAKRQFFAPSIKWSGGFVPPSASAQRKKEMTARNKDVDSRMRERWKSVKRS